jgi:anti-sigma factor RsiW
MAGTHDRVPDWLLERLAAGELPETQATELRERLKAQDEDHRLAELADSNAQILASLPPERIVPEIQRRAVTVAARTKPAAARRLRPVWVLSAVAASAAGLAFMLVVRNHGADKQPTPDESQPEVIGVKGDLRPALRIYRKTNSGSEILRAQASVHRGDTLQIRYVAAGKLFGVIASVDARGQVTLHLPETPGTAAALERDGERALPHAYELDDSPGFERFLFVTANTPFATPEVAQALKNGTALPASVATFELTLKKETP